MATGGALKTIETSLTNSQDLGFRQKLVFENLLYITPHEMEAALNLRFEFPNYVDMDEIKSRIKIWEEKLKTRVEKIALHGKEAWQISKRLSTLYLIASNLQLHKNHFENFMFFYTKGLKMMEPPARDSKWEEKPDWKILRVFAGSFSSLYYSKNGDLDTALSSITSLNETLLELESVENFNFLLSKLYSAVGLLSYHRQEYRRAESHLQRAVNLKKQYLNKEMKNLEKETIIKDVKKKNKDREILLIYVYFIYKIAKINKILKKYDQTIYYLNVADTQLQFLSRKFGCSLIQLDFYKKKFEKFQQKLRNDIKQEASNDLRQLIKTKDSQIEKNIRDVGASLLTQISVPILSRPAFESSKRSVDFGNLTENIFEDLSKRKQMEPPSRPQTSKREEISQEKILFRIRQSRVKESSPRTIKVTKESSSGIRLPQQNAKAVSTDRKLILNEEKLTFLKDSKAKHDLLMKDAYKLSVAKKKNKSVIGSQFALVKNKNEEIPKIYEMIRRPNSAASGITTRVFRKEVEKKVEHFDSISSIGPENSVNVEYIPVDRMNEESLLVDIWGKVEKNKLEQNYVRTFDYLEKEEPKTVKEILQAVKKEVMVSPKNRQNSLGNSSKEGATKRSLPAFSKKLTSKLVNEIVDDLEYDVDKDGFLNKKKKLFAEQAEKILAESVFSKQTQVSNPNENGIRKLDLSMIREARSEINEVPSLRKRLIESSQRFIPFNPYEDDGYNKTLDLVAGYDLIELNAEELIEEDNGESDNLPSTNREHKSLALSSEGEGKEGIEASIPSLTKLDFEMKLKTDVIKKMMTSKFEQTIIKAQRIFREKNARKKMQIVVVEENVKSRRKDRTTTERLNSSRKFSVLVHPEVNYMSRIVSMRRSVSFLSESNLIDIKSKRRPIVILEKDVDLKKLKRIATETLQTIKSEIVVPVDLSSQMNLDRPGQIVNISQHQRNISSTSLQSSSGYSPAEKSEYNIGVGSENISAFNSMMEIKNLNEKEESVIETSKKASQKIYRRRSSLMNSGILADVGLKKKKNVSNFASNKNDLLAGKLKYTSKMKTKAEKVKKNFQKEYQVEFGNKRLTNFKFRIYFEGSYETANIGFFRLRTENKKESLASNYDYAKKIFVLRISVCQSTYFLDIPLLDYKSDIGDKSYDTVWPIVVKALKVWMKQNNYIHEDDDILPEDNYFKEQYSNIEKNYEYKQVSEASQRCSFIAEKGSIRARIPDMISIGETKLFLENLILNYMHTTKKSNGRTLKLLKDSDVKGVFILKSSALLVGLNKIKRDYNKYLLTHTNSQKEDEIYLRYLNNQWMKTTEFYKAEIKEIQNSVLLKKNIVLTFLKKDRFSSKQIFFGYFCFNINEYKPWKESADEKDFILKIFHKGVKDEKTMSRLEFEHRFLEHPGDVEEMIKQIIYQGDVSKNFKNRIFQGLGKHVFIKNFRLILRNINKIGKNPIDDEIFKQAPTTTNTNSITIGKIRKNIQNGMEMENLFEKNFESIYEKDFKNKREENFDYIQSSGEEDSFLEEIDGTKRGRPVGSKVEVVLDDDHLFYEMERKQRENTALSRREKDKSLEDYLNLHNIEVDGIKKYYERVKMRGCNDVMFMKISIKRKSFLLGSLRIDIYRPFQRHIIYYEVHDSHMMLLILKILSMKSTYIKKKSIAHILHQKAKLPGNSYETLIVKDKEAHLDKKEVILNNETSVKTHLIKLSDEIAEKFLTKKYHFLQKLPKIGEALVTMHIYIEKNELEVEDYSFMVCFQIYPRERKTKMFKLIVNIGDIKKFFFPFDIKSNMTAEKLLRYMKSILTQMNFVRQTLYYLPSFVPIFQRRVHKIMNNDIVPLMQPLCFHQYTYTPFYLSSEFLNRKESLKKEVSISPKGKPESDRIEELPNAKKFSAPNKLKFKVEVIRWFKNYFVKHELGKTKTNVSKCFLEEYIHESRVVAQFIKKAHGEYMVVTVTKNLVLDHWSLKVYCPKTCRNFISHIQNKDLLNLKVKMLNKIFPIYLINEIDSPYSTTYKDYNFFSNKMSNYMEMINVKGQAGEQQEQDETTPINQGESSPAKIRARSLMRNVITKQVKEMIHALNVFKTDRNKKVNKIKQISMLAEIMNDGFKNSLNTPRYTNFYNFIEFYIWEKLLKGLKIKINAINGYSYFHSSKLMIEMKEVLFTNYVKIDKFNDAYVEIFIKIGEEQKESYKLFKIFEPIGYASTSSSNIYIRYLSINKLSLRLERINLREIINLYIADGFYKFQTNYMNSKLNLSDLQNLCHYIIYKIKSSNYANLIHDSSSSRKKPNKQANFFKRVKEMDDDVEINIPAYKEVLSRRPLMLIILNYFIDDKLVSINVYDVTTSQSINKEVLFSNLEEYIPGFLAKINNHMYKEMGKRIIGFMRHNLVVDASFEFMLSKNT